MHDLVVVLGEVDAFPQRVAVRAQLLPELSPLSVAGVRRRRLSASSAAVRSFSCRLASSTSLTGFLLRRRGFGCAGGGWAASCSLRRISRSWARFSRSCAMRWSSSWTTSTRAALALSRSSKRCRSASRSLGSAILAEEAGFAFSSARGSVGGIACGLTYRCAYVATMAYRTVQSARRATRKTREPARTHLLQFHVCQNRLIILRTVRPVLAGGRRRTISSSIVFSVVWSEA